jgi:rhamnosyltransferase
MNNPIPKFAVLLAAYNGLPYIKDQINSILDQKKVDLTIFISTDLSTDGTHEYVSNLARSDTRLVVLPYGQIFGGAGPNFYRLFKDVDLRDFDYLALSDQDDYWLPEKLFRAHAAILSSNSCAYSSSVVAFWESGRIKYFKKSYPQRKYDFLFESAGPGCTYVLTKDLGLNFQNFILTAGNSLLSVDYHDWLIYAFARASRNNWVIDSWSGIKYRQHSSNQLGVNGGVRAFILRAKKIIDGYGFSQALLIANLLGMSKLVIVRLGISRGSFGYLWLSLRCFQCRRKPLDILLFFISCILLAIFNPQPMVSSNE